MNYYILKRNTTPHFRNKNTLLSPMTYGKLLYILTVSYKKTSFSNFTCLNLGNINASSISLKSVDEKMDFKKCSFYIKYY